MYELKKIAKNTDCPQLNRNNVVSAYDLRIQLCSQPPMDKDFSLACG